MYIHIYIYQGDFFFGVFVIYYQRHSTTLKTWYLILQFFYCIHNNLNKMTFNGLKDLDKMKEENIHKILDFFAVT
jgi:hypothetical protein